MQLIWSDVTKCRPKLSIYSRPNFPSTATRAPAERREVRIASGCSTLRLSYSRRRQEPRLRPRNVGVSVLDWTVLRTIGQGVIRNPILRISASPEVNLIYHHMVYVLDIGTLNLSYAQIW